MWMLPSDYRALDTTYEYEMKRYLAAEHDYTDVMCCILGMCMYTTNGAYRNGCWRGLKTVISILWIVIEAIFESTVLQSSNEPFLPLNCAYWNGW